MFSCLLNFVALCCEYIIFIIIISSLLFHKVVNCDGIIIIYLFFSHDTILR
jgi:hypothetical protein